MTVIGKDTEGVVGHRGGGDDSSDWRSGDTEGEVVTS